MCKSQNNRGKPYTKHEFKKPKKKHARHSVPLERKIEVQDQTWRWEIQKRNIKFLSPDQKFYMMKVWDFIGVSQEEYSEANRMKLVRITPKIIREYIEENLIA